jgi:hypothetical protein
MSKAVQQTNAKAVDCEPGEVRDLPAVYHGICDHCHQARLDDCGSPTSFSARSHRPGFCLRIVGAAFPIVHYETEPTLPMWLHAK